MTKTIRHQFYFEQPPEVVWAYLTQPELMALWLMKSNFKLEMGYEFQFRTGPMPQLNIDGIFHCKVLEIIPCKKLVYSWQCGPGDGKIELDSLVVWQLNSRDNGTELLLEHSGFREIADLDLYNGFNEGWVKNVQKIMDLLKEK